MEARIFVSSGDTPDAKSLNERMREARPRVSGFMDEKDGGSFLL
jgi:hypothetical protein